MEAMTLERSTCEWCDGDGYLPGESPAKRCSHCNGRGTKSGNMVVARKLPDDVVLALSYSRNFAEANPRLTKTAKEHILGLCDLLEKHTAHLAQPAQAVDVGAARLQARADEIERAVGDGWISVDDRLPEPCQFVLASYLNTNGKGRVIRAMYAAPRTLELHMDAEGGEYDEETDTYWCEPGWYEANDNEEIHWFVAEKVTHWMPLPASPTPDKEGA